MFERVDVELTASLPDAVTCSDAADFVLAEERRAAARRLAYAAHWADLHPFYDTLDRPAPACPQVAGLGEDGMDPAVDGVPLVAEFAATELGVRLQTTTGAAARLMRDALHLRHRHPSTWADVMTGRIESWKGRKLAQATATAGLTLEQARWVDERVARALATQAFPVAMEQVAAEILAVDPIGQEARRQTAAQERYVSKGTASTEHGLATLIVKTTKGDLTRFSAMVDHLADLLALDGDSDTKPLRRVKAFALLANPAVACLFLARDRNQPGQSAHPPVAGEAAAPAEDTDPSAAELAAEIGRPLAEHGPRLADRLRPRTSLHLHLDQAMVTGGTGGRGDGAPVAHCEETGPLSEAELKDWLGTDHLTIRPVLDPLAQAPVDSHTVPADMREALQLLHPVEVFPYGTAGSRHTDKDHTTPYVPLDHGGPPGQTRIDNVGPLGRHHHRAKTFGGFTCHQPLPGLYLWRTPTGHWYQVDTTGTTPLGRQTPALLDQLAGTAWAGSTAEAGFVDRIRISFELAA
jgi:hypothetical protein